MKGGTRFDDTKHRLSVGLCVIIIRILDPCIDTRPDARRILDDRWFQASEEQQVVRTVESEKRLHENPSRSSKHDAMHSVVQLKLKYIIHRFM